VGRYVVDDGLVGVVKGNVIPNFFSADDMDAVNDHWIRLLGCAMLLRDSGDSKMMWSYLGEEMLLKRVHR
jgi:hypothetical protein